MTRLAALLARLPDDPRPDGALLAAFLADRDEPAFAELVRRHGRLVWGTCRRLLPDPADAEDAFQATFLVLVRRAGRLTRSGTVGPWLYRVASLTARNLRRKNARRLARTEPLSAGLNPAARPEPSSPDVDAALAGLSERERAAIVLCLLDGLTQRQAADRLGLPEGTVSARVSRGLAKLRDRLGAEPATLVVGLLVPAATAEAAARAAVAYQLAATAPPAVASLVDGVLRMFWLKKAAAAGLVTCVLIAAGVGLSMRPVPSIAAGDQPAAGAATSTAQALPPVPRAGVATSRIELRVSGRQGDSPFVVEEFDAGGQSAGLIRCDDQRGLDLFLRRIRIDPAAPSRVRMVVLDGAHLETVMAAVESCRGSGRFVELSYAGCIPPRYDIRAAQSADQHRYSDKVFAIEDLRQILLGNLLKC